MKPEFRKDRLMDKVGGWAPQKNTPTHFLGRETTAAMQAEEDAWAERIASRRRVALAAKQQKVAAKRVDRVKVAPGVVLAIDLPESKEESGDEEKEEEMSPVKEDVGPGFNIEVGRKYAQQSPEVERAVDAIASKLEQGPLTWEELSQALPYSKDVLQEAVEFGRHTDMWEQEGAGPGAVLRIATGARIYPYDIYNEWRVEGDQLVRASEQDDDDSQGGKQDGFDAFQSQCD